MDSSLRYALRTKKDLRETVEMEKFQQYILQIDEALQSETPDTTEAPSAAQEDIAGEGEEEEWKGRRGVIEE